MTRGGNDEKPKFRVVSAEAGGAPPAHENQPYHAGDHVMRDERLWIVQNCYEAKKGWYLNIYNPETKQVLEGVSVKEVDIIWPTSETSGARS